MTKTFADYEKKTKKRKTAFIKFENYGFHIHYVDNNNFNLGIKGNLYSLKKEQLLLLIIGLKSGVNKPILDEYQNELIFIDKIDDDDFRLYINKKYNSASWHVCIATDKLSLFIFFSLILNYMES